MDGQKYSFKDVFSLRIRLCLLAVLLIFILGFIFSPELKKQPAGDVPPPRPPIPIVPDPDEVVNIDEKPISDLRWFKIFLRVGHFLVSYPSFS